MLSAQNSSNSSPNSSVNPLSDFDIFQEESDDLDAEEFMLLEFVSSFSEFSTLKEYCDYYNLHYIHFGRAAAYAKKEILDGIRSNDA